MEASRKIMALEAAVFPHGVVTYSSKDLCDSLAAALTRNYGVLDVQEGGFVEETCNHIVDPLDPPCGNNWVHPSSSMAQHLKWEIRNASPEIRGQDHQWRSGFPDKGAHSDSTIPAGAEANRRKRRRTKSCKNKEEVENQRMTHIAVERNRRKQMNEYLATLRSLMPPSYVQRSDQASIIGGAVNLVKELERLLLSLEAQKRVVQPADQSLPFSPFVDFFNFPQYSSSSSVCSSTEGMTEGRSAMADIEVTLAEDHANVKVLSKKRPQQLLRIVYGLQSSHLTVLHLNVTTHDQMALYSFSLKAEDECGLSSVDEIATAVHQIIVGINQEVHEQTKSQALSNLPR